MENDFFKYVSLKTIVSLFLDENEKSHIDADRAWIMAWRALIVIFNSVSAEPCTVRIPKNANDTVTLPADYAGWSKIGVLNDDNTINTLRINNNLTLWRDNNPNRISALFPDTPGNTVLNIQAFPFYLNYMYNGFYYVLNEAIPEGINYAGQCRVDEKNGVIVLDKHFQYDSVMLEYKAVPNQNEDYMVEAYLQEAIIAFINWKMKLGKEQDFYNRLIEGRRSLPNKKVTLQQLDQMARYGNAYKIRV